MGWKFYYFKKMVLCYNYFANLFRFKLKYLYFWHDLHIFFYMIWVSDECRHGDAIPVSQQFAECVFNFGRIQQLGREDPKLVSPAGFKLAFYDLR